MKLGIVVHDDEDGLWAEVPALRGCVTQGETMEELFRNVHEAIEAWLAAAGDDHRSGERTKRG